MNLSAEANRELARHYARLAEMQEVVPQFERQAERAIQPYSILRALQALREDRVQWDAPRELAASERIAEQIGRPPGPGNLFVPVPLQRDLVVATGTAGGYLLAASADAGKAFVGGLHAVSLMGAFGVATLPMQGNLQVPRITANATTTWLANEGSSVSESTPVIGAATASPKTVGAYFEVSGQLFKQIAPATENFVMAEAGKAVGGAVSAALIAGSGTGGQPQGIVGSSGVGTQSGTSLAWSGVLNMIETVETASALISPDSAGFAVAPGVAELLRGREKATGSGFIMAEGKIAGFKAIVSAGVPSGTMVFGDWQSVILPTWGVLEIGTDPYGANGALFKSGIVGVRALWSIDVALLRPASFCVASSIT